MNTIPILPGPRLFRLLVLAAVVLALVVPTASAQSSPLPAGTGIVLVAHGSDATWNAPVHQLATRLRATVPTEVAFLMGDEHRDAQSAYERLVAAGVRQVVVVPLLVSSHSAHAEQVRYIAGLRADYPHAEHMHVTAIRGDVPVLGAATGLDDHPILGAILADRARALSTNPADETLVLVAHGPNEDADAALWLSALRSLADQIATRLPFRHVDVHLLRDDAPAPVKDKALAELRAAVERHTTNGRAVVVPVLLGAGRVAGQIPDLLRGLPIAWSGAPVLPDDRLADWVLAQARGIASSRPTSSSALRRDEQVVVTATRTEQRRSTLPVDMSVVDREVITATGARSVADVLAHEAGIEVVPSLAGDGVQLQGISAKGVLILVDGQEVIGKVSGSVDIANFLVDDIDRIEVVKGAGSALYGSDALGGVVNIRTRTATQPFSFSAEQRIESLDGSTTLVSSGARRGNWSLQASASRVARDGYDLTPDEPTTTGSDYVKHGLNGRVGYTRGTTQLSVGVRYYADDARDVSVSQGAIFDDVVTDERWQTLAELRVRPSARGTLSVRGHLGRYSHSYDHTRRSTGAVTPDLTLERLGEVEVQYDYAVTDRHLVSAGAEYDRLGMTSDRIAPARRDLDSVVGFLQDQWFVHDRINVVTGLRYDRNVAFGSAWSPKAAVLVTPTDDVRLRASFGEGFKAPEFKDLYYQFANRGAGYRIIGNEALRAETSRSINAGVDLDLLSDRVVVEVAAFRHRIDDLIDYEYLGFDPTVGLVSLRTANVGRAGTHGVDTTVTLRPHELVTAALVYSRLTATDLDTNEPLTGRSRNAVKARLSVIFGQTGLRANVFGRFVGSRAFADADGDGRVEDFAPAMHLWDLRLAQRIGRGLDLFIGAENLLDEQDIRYYATAGRRIYAGITVSVDR